jgi:hypothetical protein
MCPDRSARATSSLEGGLVSSCCSSFECEAGQQFNTEKVARELKRYRAKGPGPTTRLLVDGIVAAGESRGDVLDIGAGLPG